MKQSAASLLFPEYRRRVLALLLLRPEEALHGREIARRTGLSSGTVIRELNKLAEAGMLKRERRGNQQLYSADTASTIHAELASILRKTSGLADVLVDAVAPLESRLEIGFVFGSMASGRETAGSDIDVMLIGDLKFREVVLLLHPAQEALGRAINPQVFTPLEFAEKARTQSFVKDLLAKPKLFLKGNERELEELVGHQR